MIHTPKADNRKTLKADDKKHSINNESSLARADSIDNGVNHTVNTEIYEQLKEYEQQWWQARQQLIKLRSRQVFWFNDSSTMTWLLWQLFSYVIVAIVLMLLGKVLEVSLSMWHYLTIFGLQTLAFILALAFKGSLSERMQRRIQKADIAREQALNEMVSLASSSIFPYVHAKAPISLQTLHQCCDSQLRLASLQRLLQTEIEAGRLILEQHQIEAEILPPEIADAELSHYANEMIYKSVAAYAR